MLPGPISQPPTQPGLLGFLQAMQQGGKPNGNISNTTGMFGGVSQIPSPAAPVDKRPRPNINPYMQLIMRGLGGGGGFGGPFT